MMISKRYTILKAKILFVMVPPLAAMTMEKLSKVATATQLKTKFSKIYPT